MKIYNSISYQLSEKQEKQLNNYIENLLKQMSHKNLIANAKENLEKKFFGCGYGKCLGWSKGSLIAHDIIVHEPSKASLEAQRLYNQKTKETI